MRLHRCAPAVTLLVAAFLASCSRNPGPDVMAESLGPPEVVVASFASLIDESQAGEPCVAIAEAAHRNPTAAPADGIVETLRAMGFRARLYRPQCDRDGSAVVAIAWIEVGDDEVTVAASRWYGKGVRGGVLCDLELTRRSTTWVVRRPCSEGVLSVVN